MNHILAINRKSSMKRLALALLFSALFVIRALSQGTVTVTATITDSQGTVWTNAACTAIYAIPAGVNHITNTVTGQGISPTSIPCTANSSGHFSITIVSTTNIGPPISGTTFTVCANLPNAQCYTTSPINIGASTQDVSAQITATIPPPTIAGVLIPQAYADSEVNQSVATEYLRITDNTLRCYTGTWGACGAGSGGPPTGAAGGVLSGTYPNPGYAVPPLPLAGGTVKYINGVSYSNYYTGATLDIRVNACLADAIARTNGNTSGICDSSGEGGTQTIAAQIAVGNSSGNDVTWKLPENCAWSVTSGVGSSNAAIYQYPQSAIIGTSAGRSSCVITDNAGNGGINALWQTYGTGYYRAEGFELNDPSYSTTSTYLAEVTASYDTSLFQNIGIQAYNGSLNGLLIGSGGPNGNTCCSGNWKNLQINGNYTGGILLDIETATNTLTSGPQALWFSNISLAHAGQSEPALKVNNSVGGFKNDSSGIFGLYIEVNHSNNNTAPIQITGSSSFFIDGLTIDDVGAGGATQTGITISNAATTSFHVTGMNMYNGFTVPSTAIVNSATGETVLTDLNGNLNSYYSNLAYATQQVVSKPDSITPAQCLAAAAPVKTPCIAYSDPGTFINEGNSGTTGTITLYTSSAPASGSFLICPAISISNTGSGGTANLQSNWTTPNAGANTNYNLTSQSLSSYGTNVGCYNIVTKVNTTASFVVLAVSGAGASTNWETHPVVYRIQ